MPRVRGCLHSHEFECSKSCSSCCMAFKHIGLTDTEYNILSKMGARTYIDTSKKLYKRLSVDGGCEFLENNKCTIYSLRPEVCRKFACKDILDLIKME